MCRWLGYTGSPILLDDLLFKPTNSLIHQSLLSKEGAEPTNGDGFGVGWYDDQPEPGVFKSIEPAWNDHNLVVLSRHIKSPLFLAHVRATTGTPIQKTNCHPFHYKNWMMVHNGVIYGFEKLKRDMAFTIDPDLYYLIHGTTDSELLFYLAITFGLEKNPKQALQQMAGFAEDLGRRNGQRKTIQMTLGISDGERLMAVRYSSEHKSRSLYHSTSIEAMKKINPDLARFSDDARAIVSEPLGDLREFWEEIPESSFVMIDKGRVIVEDFRPEI